jgi:hypothetical protein
MLRAQQLVTGAEQVTFAWSYVARVLPIHRFEFTERVKQPRHVLGCASVQDVNIDRSDRRTVEHCGKPTHRDELDIVPMKHT